MKIVYNQEFLASISTPGSKVTIKDYKLGSYENKVKQLTGLLDENYVKTQKLSPESGVYSFDSIWDSTDKKLYINLEVPELDTGIIDSEKYKIIYVYYSDYYNSGSNESKIAFILIGDYDSGSSEITISPLRLSLGKNLITIDLSLECKGNIETSLDEDTKFLEGKGPDTGVNIYYALEKIEKMDEGEDKTAYLQSLVSIGSWENYIRDLMASDSNIDSSSINPYFDINGIKVFNSFLYYEYSDFKIYFDEISDEEIFGKVRYLGGDQEGDIPLVSSVHVKVHIRKNGRDTIVNEYDDTNIQSSRIVYQFNATDSEGTVIDNWAVMDENTNTIYYSQNPDACLIRNQSITAKYITNVSSGETIDSNELLLVQEEGLLVFEIIEDNEYYYFNENIASTDLGKKRLKLLESYGGDYVNFDIKCNGIVEVKLPDKLIVEGEFEDYFAWEEIDISSIDKYRKRYQLRTKKMWPGDPYLCEASGEVVDISPICEKKEKLQDPVSGSVTKSRFRPFEISITATGNGKLSEGVSYQDKVYSIQKAAKVRTSMTDYNEDGSTYLGKRQIVPNVIWNSERNGYPELSVWDNRTRYPIIPFIDEDTSCHQCLVPEFIYPYGLGTITSDKELQINMITISRSINLPAGDHELYVTVTPYDEEIDVGNIENYFNGSYENEDYYLNLFYKDKDMAHYDLTDIMRHPEKYPNLSSTDDLAFYKVSGSDVEDAGIKRKLGTSILYYKSYPRRHININIPGYVNLTPKKPNLEKREITSRRWCISWYPRSKFPTSKSQIENWQQNWMDELSVLRVKVNTNQEKGKDYILNDSTEEIVLKDFNAVPFYLKSNFKAPFIEINLIDENELPEGIDKTFWRNWWMNCQERLFEAFDPPVGYIKATSASDMKRMQSEPDYNKGSLMYIRLKATPKELTSLLKNGRAHIGTLILGDQNSFNRKAIKVFFDMNSEDILRHYPDLVFNGTTNNMGYEFLSSEIETKGIPIYTNRPLYLPEDSGLGEVLDPDRGVGEIAKKTDDPIYTFLETIVDGKIGTSRSLNLTHEYYDGDEAHGTRYKCSYFHIKSNTKNLTTTVYQLLKMSPRAISNGETEKGIVYTISQLGVEPKITFSDPDLEEPVGGEIPTIILGSKEGDETTFSVNYNYVDYLDTEQDSDGYLTEIETVYDDTASAKLTTTSENTLSERLKLGTLSFLPEAGTFEYPKGSDGEEMVSVKLMDIFYDGVEIPKRVVYVEQQSKDYSIGLVEVDSEGEPYTSPNIIPCGGETRYYKVDTNYPSWNYETIGPVGMASITMSGVLDLIWKIPDRNPYPNKSYDLLELLKYSELLKPILSDVNSVGLKVYNSKDSGNFDKVVLKQSPYTRILSVIIDSNIKSYLTSRYYLGKYNQQTIEVSGAGDTISIFKQGVGLSDILIDRNFRGPKYEADISIVQIGDYTLPAENVVVINSDRIEITIPPFLDEVEKERYIGVTISLSGGNNERTEVPFVFTQRSIYFKVTGKKDAYFFSDGTQVAGRGGNYGLGGYTRYSRGSYLVGTTIQTNLPMTKTVGKNWVASDILDDDLDIRFFNARTGTEKPIRQREFFSHINLVTRQNENEYTIYMTPYGNCGARNASWGPNEGYLRFYTRDGVFLDDIHFLQGYQSTALYEDWRKDGNLIYGGDSSNTTPIFLNDNPLYYGTKTYPYMDAFAYSTTIKALYRLTIYENPEANSYEEITKAPAVIGRAQCNCSASPAEALTRWSYEIVGGTEVFLDIDCKSNVLGEWLFSSILVNLINPYTGGLYYSGVDIGSEGYFEMILRKPKR